MARERLQAVKGGKTGKSYTVGYDPQAKTVYIELGGLMTTWVSVGKASSPQEAMRKADAYVWDR